MESAVYPHWISKIDSMGEIPITKYQFSKMFGHWVIGIYLMIGACLPAGRQGSWLLFQLISKKGVT
jgi:hypothetical protein